MCVETGPVGRALKMGAFLKNFFPMGWTCLLHFMVVEMRAAYLFYISVKSFTVKIALSSEMERQLGDESAGLVDWTQGCIHDHDLDDTVECVKAGVKQAIWTFWIDDDNMNGCYRVGHPGVSYVGLLHLSALGVIMFMYAACLLSLFLSDSKDWRSGSYLYFTWRLEHTVPYRIAAYTLVAYTCCALAYVLMVSYEVIPNEHLFLEPNALLQLVWSDAFGLAASAFAFTSTHDPPFNWQVQALQDAHFCRPLMNIVSVSNDAFGRKLEHAILKARLDEFDELEALMGKEFDEPPFTGPKPDNGEDGRIPLAPSASEVLVALRAVDDGAELPSFWGALQTGGGFFGCGTKSPSSSRARKPQPQQQQEAQPLKPQE